MELVEATRADLDLLAEYWYDLATSMEQYGELNEIAQEGPQAAIEGFEGLFAEDETSVYLIVAADEQVGFLVLREHERPSRVYSSVIDIVDLYVAPEWRDGGFGSEAIDAVEAIAQDRDADSITVSCEWHNDGARRFYEDNGFEPKQVTYAQRVD